MYGLVNRGIRDLAIKEGGDELWARIRERAGVELDDFLSMQAYEDDVTVALVGAASAELDVSAYDLLRRFGHHWVLFTGSEGYGPLMDISGDSLEHFLMNLDQMHARIKMSMPELDPPSFVCEKADDKTIMVQYFSNREGLAAMVVGLLEGLAEKFGDKATVELVSEKQVVSDADVLRISLA
ncbi:MAG: heme NO-binding domain-containing protein [Pseudomonadota bacterium]